MDQTEYSCPACEGHVLADEFNADTIGSSAIRCPHCSKSVQMLPLREVNRLRNAPSQPSANEEPPARTVTQTGLPDFSGTAPVEADTGHKGGAVKTMLGFVASVIFTLLVAFMVPYIFRMVIKLSDWIGDFCWATFPVKIFPNFWLLIAQGWNIFVFYVFGVLVVGIICGAVPAILTTELTRALGLGRISRTTFFLGVPAVAYGIFGYLMWKGIIPADLLWFRLHAEGPIRKVLIVLITVMSAMVPFVGKDIDDEKAESPKTGSAEDSGSAPPPA